MPRKPLRRLADVQAEDRKTGSPTNARNTNKPAKAAVEAK
jgi:hypothetical protein